MKKKKKKKKETEIVVTGQLLGLDVGSTLEITNCFPFPSILEEDDDDNSEYQYEMMKCLREVNADINYVGWYSSTDMNSFWKESTIETQYTYQERLPKSVVIIYDPIKSMQGLFPLRAYRLTNAFVKLFKKSEFNRKSIMSQNLSFRNVFEEIQIQIKNSKLASAFLYQLEESNQFKPSFDVLNLSSTNYFLEKKSFNLTRHCSRLFGRTS